MKITKKRLFDFCNENNDAINELQSQSNSTDFVLAVLIQQLKDSGVIDEISPEPKPQLKQLDQSVFDGLSNELRFASVDDDGRVFAFDVKPELMSREWDVPCNKICQFIDDDYDASNWQNSLIERDIAKELLEIDLSSELTGSELCRAMLERGDKYVLCRTIGGVDVISGTYEDGYFVSLNGEYEAVAPINNQGEPLTQSDVGL